MAKRTEDKTILERNEMLNEAIRFAVEAHAGQLRKGSELPYIVHAMEVLSILAAISSDIDLLMAGVLHDCIEDGLLPDGQGGMRGVTHGDIARLFGERTAALVAAHSEDKNMSWEERKVQALKELEAADDDLQNLILADKLSNMRAIARDYKAVGDELWKRFHAPKEKQSWYYSESVDALDRRQYDEKAAPFFWELNELYKDVFVAFYYDPQAERIGQWAMHEDFCHLFDRGECIWYESSTELLKDAVAVSRIFTERLEDNWTEELMDVSLGPVN
jgi:hypothetical protein